MRATDNALNISTHPNAGCCTSQLDANRNADGTTALSFTYDNAPPVSLLTNPAPGARIQNVAALGSISGTAYTDVANTGTGAGVDQVLLNLSKQCGAGVASWWNGTTWVTGVEPSPPSFSPAFSAPIWSIGFTNSWDSGCQYGVFSRARDAATNVEASEGSGAFIVDLSTPVASVQFPANDGFAGSGR